MYIASLIVLRNLLSLINLKTIKQQQLPKVEKFDKIIHIRGTNYNQTNIESILS